MRSAMSSSAVAVAGRRVVAHHADMLDVIPRLVAQGVVCDAAVTDPPYHLLPTVKRFGPAKSWSGDVQDGRYHRLQGGFRGQQWDGGDIAFRPETWATIATILRPGAFLVAFGGTRTYHRLVCAIEDAGFTIQDTIAWLYGSGFPKRRDMLKPAWESIVLAQKPPEIRSTLCALRNSLAQMATSQCGMATITALSTVSSWLDTWDGFLALENTSIIKTELSTTIDWKILSCCLSKITPESIILAHSPGHLSSASASPAIRFFDANVQKLKIIHEPSAQEFATSPGLIERLDAAGLGIEPICLAYKPGGKRTMQIDECRIGSAIPQQPGGLHRGISNIRYTGEHIYDDSPRGRWPANVCHDGSEEVLEAFAAFGEKTTNPAYGTIHNGAIWGQAGDHPVMISGDSGTAARFFYCAKADTEDRWGSRHPTVKPIELMRWLVRLVTPPDGLVLDPFAGTGTTGVAALAEGRKAILIEREEQYFRDIKERLAFHEGSGGHSLSAKGRARLAIDYGPLFA